MRFIHHWELTFDWMLYALKLSISSQILLQQFLTDKHKFEFTSPPHYYKPTDQPSKLVTPKVLLQPSQHWSSIMLLISSARHFVHVCTLLYIRGTLIYFRMNYGNKKIKVPKHLRNEILPNILLDIWTSLGFINVYFS